MTHFTLHPTFYNRPIRLTQEEQADPLAVLQDFFACNHLHEIRELLWNTVESSLSAPDSAFGNATGRQNLLGMYGDIERALEAALLLSEQGG